MSADASAGLEPVTGRLPSDEYERVVRLVPVICVDVLPWRSEGGSVAVGLIEREIELGARGWNMVGGGVYRGETLEAAIARHMRDTLGDDVDWEPIDTERPDAVEQYFPSPTGSFPVDPRKHAVALSFATRLDGTPRPQGEALGFSWFAADALPDVYGFGQGAVIRRLVERLVA